MLLSVLLETFTCSVYVQPMVRSLTFGFWSVVAESGVKFTRESESSLDAAGASIASHGAVPGLGRL